MLRTDLEKAQETKRWKNYLSDLNSIPLDENYEYKDVNDPYERLMQHVKSWIESTFGKYTDKEGLLKKLPKEKLTQEGKDWVDGKTVYVSDIKYGWFNAIMKNTKNGKEVIPYLNMEDIKIELSWIKDDECYLIDDVKSDFELTNDEKKIIEFVVNKFKDFNAKEIVNYMHQEKAYQETELFSIISYNYSSNIRLFDDYK